MIGRSGERGSGISVLAAHMMMMMMMIKRERSLRVKTLKKTIKNGFELNVIHKNLLPLTISFTEYS